MTLLQLFVRLSLAMSLFGSVSCNKIKHKKQQLGHAVNRFFFEKKEKVFPEFDSATPDTESNKRRFKDFLGIAPTSDVKNIYCYADRMGIDASYSFVFNCEASTHQAIIKQLGLKPDSLIQDFATGGFGTDVWWWDKAIPASVKPYSRQEKDLRWHLWRDQKNGKDYFLTYDM